MQLKTQGLFTLLFYFFSTTLLAQTSNPLYLLSSKDSVLLTVEYGQKMLYHRVKPEQTLYGIAQFYALSMEDLYTYNPEYQTDWKLEVGAQIRVPIPNRAILRYKVEGFDEKKHTRIYYIVQQGETLYHICKRYFDMPVDTIMERNKLKNANLTPGQLLFMGWIGIQGVNPEWRTSTPGTAGTLREQFEASKLDKELQSEQGVCFWHKDSEEKGDLYALHNTAKPGTVIAVTNPMGNRTVYAKVIGAIPYGYKSNISLILSPEAARRLGARDPQFFVRMKYYK